MTAEGWHKGKEGVGIYVYGAIRGGSKEQALPQGGAAAMIRRQAVKPLAL